MGRGIRDDAVKAEAEMLKGARVYGPGEAPALPDLVGRIYQIEAASGQTVSAVETSAPGGTITIERIKRDGKIIGVDPNLKLERGGR